MELENPIRPTVLIRSEPFSKLEFLETKDINVQEQQLFSKKNFLWYSWIDKFVRLTATRNESFTNF